VNDDAQTGLPSGWVQASLSEIAVDRTGTVDPRKHPDEWFELYSVPSFPSRSPEVILGRGIGSHKQTVEPETVLLCGINPRINRVWVVSASTPHRKIASTEWIAFSPVEGVFPRYLAFYLQRDDLRDYLASNASGVGGSLMRVKSSTCSTVPFPLAPLPEQRRIVAEIEKHLTRLDAAVVALKRVQANLKRYRASVLKAACEGRLVPTEAELARAEGRDYEPADKLLTRILKERRARWEAEQLAKMPGAGKPPKDDKWRAKYREPDEPDTSRVTELPEGWVWAIAEKMGEIQLGRQRSPKNRSKNYPTKYIRAANITEKGIDLTDVLDMEFEPAELDRYLLWPGDIILSEASGSPTQVGKPAIWRDQLPGCCFQNTVIRLRPYGVPSEYLEVVFKNYYANGLFARTASGVGINHLSADKFSRVTIPIPPVSEQSRIVAEVERRLSVIEKLQTLAEANLKRAERLRQAVLKRAFEGKLVPQDPSDEPASVLLERIRAERATKQVAEKPALKRTSKRRNTVAGEAGSLFD